MAALVASCGVLAPTGLCTMVLVSSGCVTEVEQGARSRGTRLGTSALRDRAAGASPQSAKGESGARPAETSASADAAEATGARGEAASSAKAAGAERTASRVSVAVLPLGEVEYDGFALPVVHPQGEFVATHVGDAPDWPLVLGEAAEVPTGGEIVRWRREARGLVRMPRAADDADAASEGLLLGRDATAEGVLVEGVFGVGTRRIGLLRWRDGGVRWLTPSGERWGHGAIVRKGEQELLVGIHWREDGESMLALRELTGEARLLTQVQLAGEGLSFPTPFPDGSGVLVFASSERGVSVRAVPLLAASDAGLGAASFGNPAWGRVLASLPKDGSSREREDAREFARFAPFQAVAGLQALASAGVLDGARMPGTLVLAHPGKARLWRVSMDDGDGVLLPAACVAAVWWGRQASAQSAGGWFVTREDDLAYVPDVQRGERWATPARVIAQSYVPRVLQATPEGLPTRLMAFGPKRGEPTMLMVVEVAEQ
jgi:hypothetical protein